MTSLTEKTEKSEKELNHKSKWTDDIFEKNKFVSTRLHIKIKDYFGALTDSPENA